jgi:predicted transcriptional regulator
MAARDPAESQMIGSRIREARVKCGMSQSDLAVKANISLPHISDIELGKTNMMLSSYNINYGTGTAANRACFVFVAKAVQWENFGLT